MTAIELHTSSFDPEAKNSKYPKGYMKGIRDAYEYYHQALIKLSNFLPTQNVVDENTLDLLEHRLLKNQQQLLELGAKLKVSSLDEIQDLLELWHQVAIKEVAPTDVTLTDELVLVIYDYFAAQTAQTDPLTA